MARLRLRSRLLTIAIGATALSLAGAFAALPARAIIVERVVAIVGDRPVLLSELETRTRPFRFQVLQRVPPGPQRAAANDQINREMLGKIIDEELEKQAADRAHITVTSDEIDNAFKNIAAGQGLSVADLYKDARLRSGLSEQDYREEIRRQILEGKMLQLRVKGRIRITEEDVRTRFEHAVKDERKQQEYHPAWIVIRVMPGSSAAATIERGQLAKQVAASAARGEDFAALAAKYSDDTPTREAGGDLGLRAPRESPAVQMGKRPALGKELEDEAQKLEPGETAGPIRTAEAFVVLKLMSRAPSRYKSLPEARAEMMGLIQQEQFERAKRRWLDELKIRTHVDVRL